jgi:hypothetical protein
MSIPVNQVILYVKDSGGVAMVMPTPECLQHHTIQEIAIKDVPAGKPFKIVTLDDLPVGIPQSAWSMDAAVITDGIGGPTQEFDQ